MTVEEFIQDTVCGLAFHEKGSDKFDAFLSAAIGGFLGAGQIENVFKCIPRDWEYVETVWGDGLNRRDFVFAWLYEKISVVEELT